MKEQTGISRLHELPSKVSTPIKKLLGNGLLDEKTVAVVLEAGALDTRASRNPFKLLSFVAGYLYLESKRIPVADTVRMAKKQGRRINLDWSAQRWEQEHDRLARAEALARLAGENVVYDVSKYDALLPSFPGYLIRSSRRLGMEGLRQRHCVASYHDQVKGGSCVIACVFVDGRRWTVQLSLANDADSPLRVRKIKTRFNEEPTMDVRKRIHDMLGIKLADPAPVSNQEEPGGRIYMDNLRAVLPVLRAHGIGSVQVEFDGYGDSGSIQSVAYDGDGDNHPVSKILLDVAVVTSVFEFEHGRWVKTRGVKRTSLGDAIEALTYDYLEETGVDWYNDDGGYGELVIEVGEGTVSLEVSSRYTESNLEFGESMDIETGEMIDR